MQSSTQEQIDTLLSRLSHEELLMLLNRVMQWLQQTKQARQPLFGVWKGKFPEGVDIDETLREIRHRWTDEQEEPTR